MVFRLFGLLFGCRHKRVTRPITPVHKHVAKGKSGNAYVACLDCGRQFQYDVENMRMGAAIHAAVAGRSSAPAQFQSQY
jgi:hypothetical protein